MKTNFKDIHIYNRKMKRSTVYRYQNIEDKIVIIFRFILSLTKKPSEKRKEFTISSERWPVE